MPVRKKTSTTRLPQSLLQEIDEAEANNHPHKRRRGPQLSRKDARKQERDGRKQKKAEFFSHASVAQKRSAEEEHEESPKRKKTRHDPPPPVVAASIPATAPSVKPTISAVPSRTAAGKKPEKSVKAAEKPAKKPTSSVRRPARTQKEEEEEEYIAYLESKLGYSKDKTKKKKGDDDGLDDLFDFADSLAIPSAPNFGLDDLDEDDDVGMGDDSQSEVSESEASSSGSEWGGIDEDSGEDDPITREAPVSEEISSSTPKAGAAYVPPHLRNAQAQDGKNAEEMQKLTRQLKGLLNRMSEQNLATILDSIEEVYRNHRRNDVTSAITNLIIDGVSAHALLLDSYVVLHAAFVASLHKIMGIEFAAHFVQAVVSSYERHYEALQSSSETASTDTEGGKESSNLLVLLSELYNFQVISSVLVFDVIRGLLKHEVISEFNIELLLKITRNSGQQLRLDDPSALKDIITIVQSKVSDKDDGVSSRTRFMIETLTNLKNNKLKRNVTQNQGGAAVERMKKFLSGLSKTKHVLAHEPLRISLEDLHSAETKGKWWLVGAAWGGDPLVDRQDAVANSKLSGKTEEPKDAANDLLKLARKQGMNTDIRRSIFVVLMSSEDYVDACERLSQLNLTEIQQREIIRVILHCCGNEKSYNPYYTLVGQQLCRTSHGYKITLQFSLWDFLRDLGETGVGGAGVIKNMKNDDGFDLKDVSKARMRNVARAYSWWIAKGCVTLAILKPVDFTMLKPQTREFLKEMLTQIFINTQVTTPLLSSNLKDIPITRNRSTIEEVFIKASRIEALAMGLVYFLSDALQDNSYADEGMSKFIKWAIGLAKDILRTGVDVI